MTHPFPYVADGELDGEDDTDADGDDDTEADGELDGELEGELDGDAMTSHTAAPIAPLRRRYSLPPLDVSFQKSPARYAFELSSVTEGAPATSYCRGTGGMRKSP